MDTRAAAISPGQFEKLFAFGEEVILHLTGAQTGGKLTLWTAITPPGSGPPLHRHLNEDEWFVVQEGNVAFFFDDEWHELGPGGVAFLPRKSIHTFKNVGSAPSRMLIQTIPSGFETFFSRCAEEFARPGGPEMERIVRIGAEHGMEFLTPGPTG